MIGKPEHQGRIVPAEKIFDSESRDHLIEKMSLQVHGGLLSGVFRKQEPGDREPVGFRYQFEGGLVPTLKYRLFPENNWHLSREPLNEMLRSLKNEIPPKVGKANRVAVLVFVNAGKIHLAVCHRSSLHRL